MAKEIQLGQGLELRKVKIADLKEQDLNARSMPKAMFERLAETIGRDKRLESLPFCALTKEGLEIISGHHRIRAAASVGVEEVYAIIDTTKLSLSQIKAKQLAHNSIAGVDDAFIVAEIYEQIEAAEDMRESFIDIDILNGLSNMGIQSISLDVNTKSVYLTFLPTYYDRWNSLIESNRLVDQIAVADIELYDAFHEALKTIGATFNIKAVGAVICKFIDLATRYRPQTEWVSLVDVFGHAVPKALAEVLEQMLAIAIENGTITQNNKWQILEYLAKNYIAGELWRRRADQKSQ